MKNTTLFVRSLLVVAIFAGIPHALRVYSGTTDTPELYGPELQPKATIGNTSISEQNTIPLEDKWKPFWVGKYEVAYQEMKEKSMYEIREEKGKLKCYSVAFIDAYGNRFDDNRLVMEEITTKNETARALYEIDYEGEKYKLEAKLNMDEKGNIVLTYDYYGQKGKEVWTRIQ